VTDTCEHIDALPEGVDTFGPAADATGCVECLATGGQWLHLRRCLECGHIGCCDSSPHKHASAHARSKPHALIQSFEPGEEWLYCYPDDVMAQFEKYGTQPVPPMTGTTHERDQR